MLSSSHADSRWTVAKCSRAAVAHVWAVEQTDDETAQASATLTLCFWKKTTHYKSFILITILDYTWVVIRQIW